MENKIKNYSLSDQVYNLLKDSIIKGELKPGDRIVELDVAKKFGVSQAPVREALSQLKKECFVVSYRHKGTFVSPFSKKDVLEIDSFREIMEPLAIKRAIDNLQEENLAHFDLLFKQMQEAGKKNDIDGVREIDVAFHTYIYELADHTFMFQVWQDLRARANRIWYLTSQVYYEELEEVAKNHEAILEALHKRDVDACVKAFLDHVNLVKEKILNDDSFSD